MRATLTYNNWSKEEENKLKELTGKLSFNKMIQYFPNRTASSLQKKSIKLGLVSGYRDSKYTINNDYWKNLNLINCYYGGFIATDGNLGTNGSLFQINLSSKDVDLLHNFKKEVGFNGRVVVHTRKKYKSDDLMEVCYIAIHKAKKWHEDLFRHFNITPRKTYTLQPPNINNEYLEYAYIIGAIDGDGWIFKYKNQNRISIGFVAAISPVVEWIHSKLNNIYKNGYSVKKSKDTKMKNGCYYFAIQDIAAAIIIDYLRQFPVPKLARKWENPEILKYIEEQKLKHPELFKILKSEEINQYMPVPIVNDKVS
jgi:hypothetical protein